MKDPVLLIIDKMVSTFNYFKINKFELIRALKMYYKFKKKH